MIVSKIKSNHISKDIRFNSSFFLNQDAINSRLLEENSDKCLPLSEIANAFNPPIFKRQFCQNTENAIPYCQSSDVTNMHEGSQVYINKAQAIKVGSVVRKNQILVTGFGTIGNVKLANELTEGISYANNVCRIEVNANQLFGYVYAFMDSKYGRSQLNKNGSGSVVKYIEAPGIKKILIPILSKEIQERIHNLIYEASNFRVEANKLLIEAQKNILNTINFDILDFKENKINSTTISSSHLKRFEAQYFKSEGSKIIKHIEANFKYEYLKNISEPIFRPGIFKRHYVNEGVEFLGGSDIVKAIPTSEKKLSKSKTSHLDAMIIKENWILVTCGGTIGYSVLVDRMTAGKAASQHILRVIPKDIPAGYVYAFMSSNIGLKAIQSFTYGSVIPQIEPHHLELLPIPILDEEVMNRIHQKVMKYKENIGNAIEKELKAIDLIEKEIESWQKS